jgi:toxin HigB-1
MGFIIHPLDMRYVTRYDPFVIRSIRHKGLRRLHEDDDPRGVIIEHTDKLRDILARLDAAGDISDMDLPGLRLHPLKGEFKGFWAVTVRANWRVIFRIANREVLDVDYLDYH